MHSVWKPSDCKATARAQQRVLELQNAYPAAPANRVQVVLVGQLGLVFCSIVWHIAYALRQLRCSSSERRRKSHARSSSPDSAPSLLTTVVVEQACFSDRHRVRTRTPSEDPVNPLDRRCDKQASHKGATSPGLPSAYPTTVAMKTHEG